MEWPRVTMKKTVLLLNPPNPVSGGYLNRDLMGGMGTKVSFGEDIVTRTMSAVKSRFVRLPVMQLAYAASLLERRHKDVFLEVVDAGNSDMPVDSVISKVKMLEPDYVLMAVSSAGVMFEKNVVARRIKEASPKSVIATVGDTVSGMPEIVGKPFDIGISGEAEVTFLEIVEGRKIEGMAGVVYRDKKNRIVINRRRPPLSPAELDALPFPAWHLFPYKKYSYFPLVKKLPFVPMLSSRGCPCACSYCPYSENMGKAWRARSAKNVVDEIESNCVKYGIRGIQFRDPLFTASKKRVVEIAGEIKRRKIDVEWGCETRPEMLDSKTIGIMADSGCSAINLGVESIDKDVLAACGRNWVNPKRIANAVDCAERAGIRTACFFILGLPGDKRSKMQTAIEFSRELNPSFVEYKIATPYPGTRLYKDANRKNWIVNESFDKLGGYNATMKISDELDPKYLDELCDESFKKFYFRKEWLAREVLGGRIIEDAKMFAKALVIPR